MNQKRQEKKEKNPVFLIEKKVQRGDGNLIKEGNARCVFVPQKLVKTILWSIPLIPQKVDDNDSPLSKSKFKTEVSQKRKLNQ